MNGFFNVNGGELIVILLVLALVVGPERLPQYAEQLARFVRGARDYARKAKERVDDEVGESLGDVDWASLDPRQYDPRRIVRDALLDADPRESAGRPASARTTGGAGVALAANQRSAESPRESGLAADGGSLGGVVPYDDEAT